MTLSLFGLLAAATPPVPLDHAVYLALGLFAIGLIGVTCRKNVLIVLLSVEIMLNAANLVLVAFSRLHNNIDGQIISVVGGVTQIGQYQVVVLNRGSSDGLAVGDVLTVFQKGEEVRDHVKGGMVTLPDEEAGTLMVFKV